MSKLASIEIFLQSATIAAVVGAIVGSVFPLILTWWKRPKLFIDFQESMNYIVLTNNPEIYWLRLRVVNKGQQRAKACQVYLTAMHKVRTDGIDPKPIVSDPKILQWAGIGGDKQPRDIPQDLDFYVDLLKHEKAAAGWGFVFGLFPFQLDTVKASETYEFHLTVCADNAESASCKIRVDPKRAGEGFKAWSVLKQ
jgi:hypothetical protein